jgi:hypothetical protein
MSFNPDDGGPEMPSSDSDNPYNDYEYPDEPDEDEDEDEDED